MPRTIIAIFAVVLIGGFIFWMTQRGTPQPPVLSRHRIEANHQPFSFQIEHDRKSKPFRIDWPPTDPSDNRQQRSPPLLMGELIVSTGLQNNSPQLNIRIEISRADADADRLRWNRDLQFPEYDWMSRVRVWDHDQKWLWPNLPFLLRANGLERQQRYGGVDPGKGVDNDFAAMVVKSLDSSQNESIPTTAEWSPPAGGFVDKRSVVHRALSDDLQWTIPNSEQTGSLGVWLIYADFLESRPPNSWPAEPEFNGGILSYCSITWRTDKLGSIEIKEVVNTIPPTSTGVDWRDWLKSNQHGE